MMTAEKRQVPVGEWSKAGAQNAEDAFVEIMKAFPKKKVGEFLGHFNEVAVFLGRAKEKAPE